MPEAPMETTAATTAVAPPPEPAARVSAIADLSYRGYVGPRQTRAIRWWIVAASSLRMARKSPVFWIVAGLGVLPYLFTAVGMLLLPLISMNGANPFQPVQPKHAVQLYNALNNQAFFIFLAAITLGAGSIAADNRTNALLVYLSKPVTKGDYLLGKWMGLFLPLYAMALVPGLILYVFCLALYVHQGFLHDEPTLLPRIFLASAIPGIIHASLLLGISAWTKRPAVAGVIYAGLYFLSMTVINIAWAVRYHGDQVKGALFHCFSISGLIEGLAQNVYAAVLQSTMFRRSTFEIKQIAIPPPSLWALLAIAVPLVILGVAAARARIRAVEVIKG
jgi:ABC-2 type transport system permease protein